jgi:hypothetical protein
LAFARSGRQILAKTAYHKPETHASGKVFPQRRLPALLPGGTGRRWHRNSLMRTVSFHGLLERNLDVTKRQPSYSIRRENLTLVVVFQAMLIVWLSRFAFSEATQGVGSGYGF